MRGRGSGVEAPARITQLEHPRPCKEPHLPTSQDNFLPKIEEPHIATNQGLHLTKKVNAMQRQRQRRAFAGDSDNGNATLNATNNKQSINQTNKKQNERVTNQDVRQRKEGRKL